MKKPAFFLENVNAQIFPNLLSNETLNISAEANNDVAEIRISGVIHEYQNSAKAFKEQIDNLIKQGIKNVNLYINTPGGNVFEANEIANEIKRFKGTIKGYGGALVASAGSYLAIICNEFEMASNGQYMYHKPYGLIQGNEDKVASDLKLLQNLTSQYRTAYSNKTGLSEKEIENRWTKGDVWLSAQEALEQKFITSINEKQIDEPTSFYKANHSYGNHRSFDLDKIKSILKLPSDASETQIRTKINTILEDSNKYSAMQSSTKQNEKNIAYTMVQSFIDSKQITADTKSQWIDLALKDYEGTKAILATLPKPSRTIYNSESIEGRRDWKLEDYLENDPNALNEMSIDDPQRFKKLNDEYYKNN